MADVKRTFFITEETASVLRNEKKDPYITHRLPAYELVDGTIIYAKYGFPAGGETWYFTNKLGEK